MTGWVTADSRLNGFGGFHGGLALALLASAAREQVPGLQLQSITGRFDRAIGTGFDVKASLIRSGRSTAVVSARAESDKGVHIEASAVYGVPTEPVWDAVAPTAPQAPPPEDCDVLTIPPEFVPVAASMEIRPVGAARPYGGGTEPELIAWVRLLEDDDPPDVLRLIFLMDALAPSYTATLSTLALAPTIELTVRPADGLVGAASPWILVRARTSASSVGGWIDEHMEVWGRDGALLGTGHQLRILRT
ncbi:thioesterase family protein [Streptomyces sp. NPDC021098]|uniref:thioesterase family protein n=1 Tax=unclassified Streptomyces TaxID=2593676 RepID=UPI0037978AA6